ncbi:MAG: A/G-specific adenine glycosylase [Spirochaetaceae bacterium]|nr:MAG: A/G-specific adenine glycosylase [Spirochaetaceae bacterium]
MEWRADPAPYKVFISEIMLQQTQVPRVMRLFPLFLARFPGFGELANASFADILQAWTGLGYNRRARYLQEAACLVRDRHGGVLPREVETLRTLPGVGAATAGSIAAFAYNVPAIFIETNIRRVFIHHFFPDRREVHDREILPLVEQSLDRENPREWYWALMDYGALLARSGDNPNRRSRSYVRQNSFRGSDRQLRGMVLRHLVDHGSIAAEDIPAYGAAEGFPPVRVEAVLKRLEDEGFLQRTETGAIVLRR